jgi:outer membrane protein OmpA-like peptidoglycan-associated protein
MTPTVNQTVKRQRAAGALGFIAAAVVICLTLVFGHAPKEQNSFTVKFDIGTTLEDSAEAAIDAAVSRLASDPNAVVVVTGHTGTAGDLQANQALSESRAEAVADRLRSNGVNEDRIITLGAAGQLPSPREDGMGDAAYERSLPRAVITITDRSLFTKPQG